jgi:hypothetical protein
MIIPNLVSWVISWLVIWKIKCKHSCPEGKPIVLMAMYLTSYAMDAQELNI